MDRLIEAFKNEDRQVLNLLIAAFSICEINNKESATALIEKLICYKTLFKNFQIIIDFNLERSSFNQIENKIKLKDENIAVFFHELTHALSFYQDHFIPNQYFNELKDDFKLDSSKIRCCIALLRYCKNRRESIINEPLEGGSKNILLPNQTKSFDDQGLRMTSLDLIEDIIDSLFDGKSFDNGLVDLKDSKSFVSRSAKGAGHGCDYFEKTNFQFEEVLANYLTLSLLFPDTEEFELLKMLLGKELVDLLEKKCRSLTSFELDGLIELEKFSK